MMPLLFVTYFISATCFSEVSRCLHSYCNLLFAGGDSRVLAGLRVLQGRSGDGDFLPLPFPFIHLVFCWAASLSVICWIRIFLHNTFFQAEAPTLPTCLAEKKPCGHCNSKPTTPSPTRANKSGLGSSDGRQKMLVEAREMSQRLYLKSAAVSTLRWLL